MKKKKMGESRTTFGRQRHRESVACTIDRSQSTGYEPIMARRPVQVKGIRQCLFFVLFDFCEGRADSRATLHVHVKMECHQQDIMASTLHFAGVASCHASSWTFLRAICAEGGLPSLTSMPHHVTFWLAVLIPVPLPLSEAPRLSKRLSAILSES